MKLNNISKSIFINLERRKDRLKHINQNLPFAAERFEAIDAKQVKLTHEIKSLFPKTWSSRSKAEICCALSHYKIWKKLIADKDSDNYLILEDDTVFKPGFVNFWNDVYSKHLPEGAFLVYLGGCQPWNKPQYHKVLQRHNDYFYTVKKNDYFTKDNHFWHMNANSYVLSKLGASLLCQWVEQHGMDEALDNFMQNFFNENKLFAAPELVFHMNPLMSYQLHEENDNTEIDKKSDLRFAEEKFQSVDFKNKPIPKKIFQTWENDKLEGVFKYLTDRVKSYNHSYSYEFFDGEKRRDFIKDNFAQDVLECYDLIIPGAFKADLWRYCVLYKYGGIYCDIDMLCFSCFDKVIIGDEIDFFAPIDINPREDICSHAVSNAFIGSSPGHPIIKICIDLIVQNVISERWLNESMIDLDFSGPGLLGRAINLFLGRSEKSKLKGCEGIIEKGLHKIKLIYFKQGLEYMTDLGGDIIFQNKNGNQSIKRLIIQQEKDSNVRPWIEYMIGGKLPYIKKDNANDASLINPTAITYSGKQYILYRGEKYLDGKPPPLGFYKSDFSYWLEVDGVKRQCTFNFDSYTYKTIKRIDIDLGSKKSIVEDLRLIESSARETNEGLVCLATCCLLPYTRIFEGTKNEDGSWNKSRGLGLEFTFRAAYCQVNLSTAEIKFIDQIDGSSQIQNEKNWSCFINNGEYYVVYSMFPLVYTKAKSLADISFSDQDLSQELIYSSSTNPIKIGENQYLMLCHKRDKDKEFCYNYQLVTFRIKSGSICDIQSLPVNIDEGFYCSSITKKGSKIKVFAGARDLDNSCFYLDIPEQAKGSSFKNILYWRFEVGSGNFGDELNVPVGKFLFGEEVKFNEKGGENIKLIGSVLADTEKGASVCGVGFHYHTELLRSKEIDIRCVRGPLSLKTLNRQLDKSVECFLGDPALLLKLFHKPNLREELVDKIGVVPHISNIDYFKKQIARLDDFYLIDPTNSWEQVVSEIYSCRSIISSSLHGLICSDAYDKPNVWIKVPGQSIPPCDKNSDYGDFKYWDYLLSQGREVKFINNIKDDLSDKLYKKGNKIDLAKMFFAISGKKLIENNCFPNLKPISSNQIPKKIHLSWKNKNVLDSNYELIRKGAKNLELLNPDWDIEVYDDEDVNRLLRDSIGRDNWNLIKDKKNTEKTDLWRLLKTYKEGGLYVDIDRYIDTPISEIVNHKTSCVLPTFQDVDFSQDFILTCAKNPIVGRAIANNLNYRKQGKPLFFLAVYSYMQSVCEILGTKIVDRGNNPEYFNDIRKQINACEYLETYRELGPEHHILFRNINKQFNTQTFKKDKADFYNAENVVHWNAQTQAFHVSQKTKKQKLIFTHKNLFEQDFICKLFDDFDVVINEDMNIVEEDSVIVYSDMYAKNINAYPEKFSENLNKLRAKQNQYFEKLKNKNCILVHLSDEHCHAEIDHYKNFKHVFRQYYRKDAIADNVTFIPLGYKKGFKS